MEQDLIRLNAVSLKAAFVDAALYKIVPSLISYSALIADKKIIAKIVVNQKITSTEEDNIMDILGNLVGHFSGITAEFQIIKVKDTLPANDGEVLPILLFRRAL